MRALSILRPHALDLVDKNFRIKKKKKYEEVELEFDEDIDVAKPIPGKTEIMVFDRKSMNMVKKTIKFDKNIQGTLLPYFDEKIEFGRIFENSRYAVVSVEKAKA